MTNRMTNRMSNRMTNRMLNRMSNRMLTTLSEPSLTGLPLKLTLYVRWCGLALSRGVKPAGEARDQYVELSRLIASELSVNQTPTDSGPVPEQNALGCI